MKIKTENHGKFRGREEWTAYDEDTYDGPGSPVGRGHTEAEAKEHLLELLWEEEDQ